ncbi:porin [Shewanella sp.]|uniref:porin n=1 Tax=Shewanella sp. TaxID=50422 RepID=UPI003A988469
MKKSLISASVATLLTAASFGAMADGPNFYGRLDLMVTNTDGGYTVQSSTNNVTMGENGTYLENNFSWLGVKGTEKVSDGLEIVYQMEYGVENTSSRGNQFTSRNTFLGFKTVAGTAVFGRRDTVFKNSEGGIDLFGNSNADMDRILPAQTRSADVINYYSPKIADLFTLNATYLFDDNNDTVDKGDGGSQYAVSAVFGDKALKQQMFYAAAAYNKGIDGVDAYRAVGQVKLADFKVGALYQNNENTVNSDIDGNTYLLNVSYNLNGVNLKAEYIYDDGGFGQYFRNASGNNLKSAAADTTIDDVSVTSIIVGADYRLAKSTLVYSHYAHYEGDYKLSGDKIDLDDDNVFSVGVRYDF